MLKKIQVITSGHELSEAAQDYLKTIADEITVFPAFFFAKRLCQVVERTNAALDSLIAKGADVSGRTPTYVVLPGLSVATACFVSAWQGLSGQLPLVLNVINIDGQYVPSPELPVIDLNSVKNNVARRKRTSYMTQVTVLQGGKAA